MLTDFMSLFPQEPMSMILKSYIHLHPVVNVADEHHRGRDPIIGLDDLHSVFDLVTVMISLLSALFDIDDRPAGFARSDQRQYFSCSYLSGRFPSGLGLL
jgi:hypothetical protein